MKSFFIFAALVFSGALFSSASVEARHHCRNSFSMSYYQSSPAYYCPPPQPVYVYQPAMYCNPVPYYQEQVWVAVPTRPVYQPRPCMARPHVNFGFTFGL